MFRTECINGKLCIYEDGNLFATLDDTGKFHRANRFVEAIERMGNERAAKRDTYAMHILGVLLHISLPHADDIEQSRVMSKGCSKLSADMANELLLALEATPVPEVTP